MQRITLLAAITLLAGCVGPQARQAAQAEKTYGGLLSRPIAVDSVMREGDVLSFQLSKFSAAQKGAGLAAQLEASCTTPQASLLYLTGDGRLYTGANNQQYTAGQPIPATIYPVLKNNPDFIKACANTPKSDWRLVNGSGDQQWVLLDRNSLKADGPEIRFWAAYDSPVVGLSELYNAPSAQKRERYAVDCAQQNYRRVAVYDVNASNTVTDGQDNFPLAPQAISGNNENHQRLFGLVCGRPEAVSQLPVFIPRAKKTSPVSLPPLSDAVASAIQGLNLPPPIKTLSYLEVVGTHTYKGKSSELRQEYFIDVDKASQQLRERSVGKGFEDNKISFRGLFDLTAQMRFTDLTDTSVKDITSTTSLIFHGDWRQMPINSQVGFSTKYRNVNSMLGETNRYESSMDCTVARDLPASELNASLSGSAKELKCQLQASQYHRLNTYYYLQDYGYFFYARTDKNVESYQDASIKTAR